LPASLRGAKTQIDGRRANLEAQQTIRSLTRIVEHLRLTAEPEEAQQKPSPRPLITLQQPTVWTDVQTRRRLFWNAFLLDRYDVLNPFPHPQILFNNVDKLCSVTLREVVHSSLKKIYTEFQSIPDSLWRSGT
jgi:hypothetical protein